LKLGAQGQGMGKTNSEKKRGCRGERKSGTKELVCTQQIVNRGEQGGRTSRERKGRNDWGEEKKGGFSDESRI